MAVLIWSAAVLWITGLMVVATGGLVTDAAKSGRTALTLKHRVSDAERAHRGAIREAEAELARCQSAYDREVAAAKQQLTAIISITPAPVVLPGASMAAMDWDQSRRSRRRVSKVQQEPECPGDGEERFVVRSTKTTDEPVL